MGDILNAVTEREMDEKLIAKEGRTIRFKCVFVDDNLNGFDWWKS